MPLGLILGQILFVLDLPRLMGTPWFKYVLLPVVSLLAGAVVKSLYRSDHKAWTKEDCAWGPDLVLAACLMMLLLAADRAAQFLATLPSSAADPTTLLTGLVLLGSPLLMFIADGILLILLTLWIRKVGWQDADHLWLGKGFLIPWLVGALSVGVSFYFGVL